MTKYNNRIISREINFDVGHSVVVIHPGQTYSLYSDWVLKNCPNYFHLFSLGEVPLPWSIGKVININLLNEESAYLLVGVLIENKYFVIGSKGLTNIEIGG